MKKSAKKEQDLKKDCSYFFQMVLKSEIFSLVRSLDTCFFGEHEFAKEFIFVKLNENYFNKIMTCKNICTQVFVNDIF